MRACVVCSEADPLVRTTAAGSSRGSSSVVSEHEKKPEREVWRVMALEDTQQLSP